MKMLLFQVKTENICVTEKKKTPWQLPSSLTKSKLSANDSRLVNIPFY